MLVNASVCLMRSHGGSQSEFCAQPLRTLLKLKRRRRQGKGGGSRLKTGGCRGSKIDQSRSGARPFPSCGDQTCHSSPPPPFQWNRKFQPGKARLHPRPFPGPIQMFVPKCTTASRRITDDTKLITLVQCRLAADKVLILGLTCTEVTDGGGPSDWRSREEYSEYSILGVSFFHSVPLAEKWPP